MEALRKRRGIIKGLVKKNLTFAERADDTTSVDEIKSRLEKSTELWNEFMDVEERIMNIDPTVDSDMLNFDDSYYKTIAQLNALLRLQQIACPINQNLTDISNVTLNASSNEVKLPRLSVPYFSGDYREWQSFYDLFTASVHNNTSISPAQKFQYLKGLLKGEASTLIRHYTITEANYIEALKKLSKRYDKKKHTINSLIKSFFDQQTIHQPSAQAIRRLCDVSDEVIGGLRALGTQAESRDVWLIYLIVNKLDDDSRQLWSQETSDVEYPSLKVMFDFLNKRTDALEGIRIPNKRNFQTNQTSNQSKNVPQIKGLFSNSTSVCPVCSGSDHWIFECSKFLGMEVAERREFTKKSSRCFNCLNSSHSVNHCRSRKSCWHCKKRHHTLLHLTPSTTEQVHSLYAMTPHNNVSNQQNQAQLQLSQSVPSINTSTIKGTSVPSINTSTIKGTSVPSINTSTINGTSVPSINTSTIKGTSVPSINTSTINGTSVSSIKTVTSTNNNDTSVLSINTGNLLNNKNHTSDNQTDSLDKSHQLRNVQSNNYSVSVNNDYSEISMPTNVQYQSLLPTAVINVKDVNGNLQSCRALLDSGSQASFITESCVQRLGLPRRNARICVMGLGSAGAGKTRGVVSLEVSSRINKSRIQNIEALILQKLTSSLPISNFNLSDWNYIKNLPLADPMFNISNGVDMLIGADNFFSILEEGRICGPKGNPFAQNTMFGWILAGQLNIHNDNVQSCTSILSFHADIDIDKTLRRFWEIEEIPQLSNQMFTAEELECEKHYEETHFRDQKGKYVVRLPFKSDVPKLGNSKKIAFRRFKSLERRFEMNEEFKLKYISFMKEYTDLSHMEEVTPEEEFVEESLCYYIPHHAVVKETSSTTKLRVVFDASSKSTSGRSLNTNLMIGPRIQQSLLSILLRFRKHRYVFTADIEKMYRQILIHSNDRNYQRIFWRTKSTEPIKQFKLTTVTYGTSAAPYLAIKTLMQIADDNEKTHPEAALIIKRDFYVDDLMSGTNSLAEAINMQRTLKQLLSSCGMHLRKWTSNSSQFLETIKTSDHELSPKEIKEDSSTIKILGLQWYPCNDYFSFKILLQKETAVITKRELLSESSKIFDPLGWVSPAIIKIKILLQQLWLLKLEWDDPLPKAEVVQWQAIRRELIELEKIQIPRWVFMSNETSNVQLHGFADASQDAYAAVIYCRTVNNVGEISVNIVIAKSKVAPIKQISIPRLELCGALLLTRLMACVKESFEEEKIVLYAWTDSTIVLNWLSTHPRKWKTYVANRTSEIISELPRKCWNHVSSKENPADVASRGMFPSELCQSELWWKGPEWLHQEASKWPPQVQPELIELEQNNNVHVFKSVTMNCLLTDLIMKYSCWNKLIRIIALCVRFGKNLKEKNCQNRQLGFLLNVELKRASNILIKFSQAEMFQKEIFELKSNKSIDSKSKLISIYPFLDHDEILRVGGRIQNSIVPFTVKHPIILAKMHTVTNLIVNQIHLKYLHAGVSLMCFMLRQQFWIIGCKDVVRRHVHRCLTCFRQKKESSQQLMGKLPISRVQFKRPFLQTGVDYAGPILLKLSKGRGGKTIKGYLAIFVCLSTKAVHIEVVGDLSTDSFVGALKRFTSRRGLCSDIFSDNGTNFIGAKRTMIELYNLLLSEKHNSIISNYLLKDGTNWHLIPPAAPHFGGLWEAAVKSTKYHLKRVIGNSIFTLEEMSTLMTQIEAILNSRPLCALSDDELDPLTPGHFLIGHSMTLIPEPNLEHINDSRLSRWQLVQRMSQTFWKRWHKEYLTSLQQRKKWQVKTNNINIDDLVVIREDNTPPAKWALGRVLEVHPGDDGLIRVVTLKTASGIYKRPITKVAALPPMSSYIA